jgi:cell division protein FtsL
LNNEKKGLSSREKFLIGFLVVVVVVVGCAMFLYMPVLEDLGIAIEELESTTAAYEAAKEKVDASAALAAEADTQKVLLRETAAKLGVFSDTEILEREFTRYMLDNNIKTEGVAFAMGGGSNVETLVFDDIHIYRKDLGELPDTELLTLVMNVRAQSRNLDLSSLLGLPNYVNGIYSYRLLNANFDISHKPDSEHTANYVIEVVLRNH